MFHSAFFTVAALCAIVYALITVLNGWLHARAPKPSSFEETVALRENRWIVIRSWVVLLSMFFVLVAFGGIAARLFAKSPALAGLGFCFSFIFVFTEMLFRSVGIFAVRRVWMAQYAQETDDNAKTALRVLIASFNSIVGALYFVLMSSFMLGSLLFGIAAWSETLFDKLASVALFLNTFRLFLRLLEMHGNQKWLAALNHRVYVPIVTMVYLIIGVWLGFG